MTRLLLFAAAGAACGSSHTPASQPVELRGGPSWVSFGEATVAGSLDKSTIRRYVRRRFRAVESCYLKALATKPTLVGTVKLQFQIGADGTVANAALAAGIDPDMDRCVLGVVQHIVFPKPAGGGVVDVAAYPIRFSPS